MAEPTEPIYRRPMLHRLLLAVLAAIVLWQTLGGYLGWRARFAELTEIAETQGVAGRRPDLIPEMQRDAGPTRAALRLARAILADELDQRWVRELEPAEQALEKQRGRERLDIAYELGTQSLAERPGSWEALLVIGGAEYLRLARGQAHRLLLDRELWLEPLEEAHRLAPLQPEPLRFLAAADLGNWSVLTPAEREASTRRLETAFTDPTTFDLLSAAWLRVAPSLGDALAIVPEETWAWSGLTRYFARRGDWERYCDAREKAAEVNREFADERLDEAASRLRWNDRDKGIQRLLWVAGQTRPDLANVEIMERVLAMAPPGVGGEASSRWLREWLDWSLERCTWNECPLSGPALLRLIGLNRELLPHERARALSLAGELRDAEAVEREHRKAQPGELGGEWTLYLLAKARLLAARGEVGEASDLLSGVPLEGRDSILYRQTQRQVATAAGEPGQAASAETWLQAQARRRWTREDWLALGDRRARLELLPAEAAPGLELRLAVGQSGRGVLELLWDGSAIALLPSVHGRVLELTLPVSADRHLLEIRSDEGAPRASAEVRLLAPRP